MKGLNKIALATAVAAAPFATQAMEPMSDSQMGDVTGQAGVTIELETALTIDQVAYNQSDADGDTGSFLIGGGSEGIRIGGHDSGETLNLDMDIDLQQNGDALISLGSLSTTTITVPDGGGGTVDQTIPAPVELGVDVDSMGLESADGSKSATLISGLQMDMYLKQLDITAKVEDLAGNDGSTDASTGSLQVDTAFAIGDLDVTFDVAAVSLENFQMAGDGSLEGFQAGTLGGVKAAATTPAVASMTIGAGDALGQNAQPNGGDVLRINVSSFQADMWMPTVNVGGASIGSVAIDNLQVQPTNIAVYGRQ